MKRYEQNLSASIILCTFQERVGGDLRRNLITVWTPTFNNIDTVGSYFAGINMQETKYPVEVLIIDDGSNVDYLEQLKKSTAKCKFHVKFSVCIGIITKE